MKKRYRFFVLKVLLAAFSIVASGQDRQDSILLRLNGQLVALPQEKIYLHTDKPYYISGEKIWFRAHLVDAISHVPSPVSRYVYVELINPIDSVLVRVKVRQQEGAYSGYIDIPDDAIESSYTLRAYTNFMRNQGEPYFYTKEINIGDPQSRIIRTDASFQFDSEKKVTAELKFTHNSLHSPIVPENVTVSVNGGRSMKVKCGDDGIANVSFTLPDTSVKRVMLVETVSDKRRYRQFIPVAKPDNDYDVSFYPEGGSMLQGTISRVTFKALNSNGQAEHITGAVYDQDGTEVVPVKTDYLGMGSFSFLPAKDKKYHLVCQNSKGQSKQFDMPLALDNGYALAASLVKEKIYVSVLKPAAMPQQDTLYLLVHTRGTVQYVGIWDHSKKFVTFAKDMFPSGVVQLLLFDASLNPLSERLVFVANNDQAQVAFRPDNENYKTRSLAKNEVILTDVDNQPLSGSFSVAVTDDREVIPDSTANILTALLLTSELRGRIENPAYYFRNTSASAWALDMLMLTQGWRRYDVPAAIKGRFSGPTAFLEIGPEISGTVKSVLLAKPVEGVEVSVISPKGNCFGSVVTDKDGHFYFHDCELPDSSLYVVHAIAKKGMQRMELIINADTYPQRTLRAPVTGNINKDVFVQYMDKAEQKYTYENGVRTVHLTEVTISASRKKPVRKSQYYTSADNTVTEDELEKFPASDIYMILMRLPGVMVSNRKVSIRGGGDPLLVLDGIPTEIETLDMINVYDIAQVDVLKGANASVFGSRGGNGVISIFTKEGTTGGIKHAPFHIKSITPLGYQPPAEFYAPRYDTPAKKSNSMPDLRTTIHWQPDVRADSTGMASFEFYTADASATYSVIIEGVAANGKIIRQEGKLYRRDD